MTGVSSSTFRSKPPQFGGVAQSVRTLGARAARPLVAVRMSQGPKPFQFSVSPLIPSIIIGSLFLYQKGVQSSHPNGKDQIPVQRLLVESGLGYLMTTMSSGIVPILYGLGLSCYRAGQQNNALDKLHAVVNSVTTLGLGYLGVFLFSGLSEAQHRAENQSIRAALQNQELDSWKKSLENHADPAANEFSETLKTLSGKLDHHEKIFNENAPGNSEMLKSLREELAELKTKAVEQLQSLDKNLLPQGETALQTAFSHFRQTLFKSQQFAVKFGRATNPLAGYFIVGLLLGSSVAKDINHFFDKHFPQLRQKNILPRLISQDNTLIPKEFSFNPILPPANGAANKKSGGH